MTESFVAGLFQSASDVADFRLMGSVNAVHAGNRRYRFNQMNGYQYQLSFWLNSNHKEYNNTPILKVEGLPQGLGDFVNEYDIQMADLLGVDPATF